MPGSTVAIVNSTTAWISAGAAKVGKASFSSHGANAFRTAALPTGDGEVPISPGERTQLGLFFVSDAALDKTFEVKIWGFSDGPGTDERFGTYIGLLKVTIGDTEGVSGKTVPDTFRFCDEIAILEDASPTPPGMEVIGMVTDGVASVYLIGIGFKEFLVEFMQPGGETDKKVQIFYRVVG